MEKASLLVNYFFLIGIGGFVVMLVLSILAFCNVESFGIPKDKHIQSGCIVLFGSIFYGALAVGMYLLSIKQDNDERNKPQLELNTFHELQHHDINNASEKSKSDEEEEDKKSDERLIEDY